MFVKLAEGRVLRRPDTLTRLLPEGEHVPDGDEFWVRRLRDGDVVEAEPSPAEQDESAGDVRAEDGRAAELPALPAPAEESQA